MAYSPDHLSQWVDFFAWNPASRHRVRIITELLEGREFRSVLDVGCGDGSLLDHVRRRFSCGVYGLESDDSPARTRVQLDGYWQLDISKGPPPSAFDLVMATEVLEHIPDHEAALRNMRSVCRRWLLLTVPAGTVRRTDRHMGHLRHYDVEGLRKMVEAAGFTVHRCFAWGFPFHSLYKALQDVVPGAMIQGFGQGRYGLFQKLVCQALYGLFFLNLSRGGSQIFLVAEAR